MKRLFLLVAMFAVSSAAQKLPDFNPSKLPKAEKVITGTFRVETYKNGDGVLLLLINNEDAQMHAIPFTADQLNHLVAYQPLPRSDGRVEVIALQIKAELPCHPYHSSNVECLDTTPLFLSGTLVIRDGELGSERFSQSARPAPPSQ